MRTLKNLLLILILNISISQAKEINSIRDIPWFYEGVVGNLMVEKLAIIEIEELLHTETVKGIHGKKIYNKVHAKLKIGKNKIVEITNIDIEYQNGTSAYSVYLSLKNNFERKLFMSLRYDVVANVFHLRETPSAGNRGRFFLRGSM